MPGQGLWSGVSRYGSRSSSVESAAAWLRAVAARHGVECTPADRVDLAAACVAADAWMLLVGGDGVALDCAYRAGGPAVRSAGALLARAAGHGKRSPVVPHRGAMACISTESAAAAWLAELELLGQWASHHCQAQAGEVLRRAATDLAAAGEGVALFDAALLLLDCADALELPSSAQ